MKIDENNFRKEIMKRNYNSMEYLADIYGNLIYKIVYSILCKNCDISSVEECTNDVFMKIWNNIDYILYDARVIVPLK